MATVKLLVKRARFTVSISTFPSVDRWRSQLIFSNINTAKPCTVRSPNQLPFILATLELADGSVSLTLEVAAALPSTGSAQAHLSILQP